MSKSDKVDEGQKANERRLSFQKDPECTRATKLMRARKLMKDDKVSKTQR
jgi:hypothetical protein